MWLRMLYIINRNDRIHSIIQTDMLQASLRSLPDLGCYYTDLYPVLMKLHNDFIHVVKRGYIFIMQPMIDLSISINQLRYILQARKIAQLIIKRFSHAWNNMISTKAF